MPIDPQLPGPFPFILQVERLYAALLPPGPDLGLGDKLLYAAELDAQGRALVVAGNIAGAATLAATADPAAQRQAIREGIVDFLVTSLNEALRILKNEIRKCETVAVCVGASPESVEREMRQRGVLPDLLPPSAAGLPDLASFLIQGSRAVELADAEAAQALLVWSVASAPALWLPKLDAIAGECLGPQEWLARRWLRLAPRYLGRPAQAARLLRCNEKIALEFIEQARQHVERAEIAVQVEMHLIRENKPELHRFTPTR